LYFLDILPKQINTIFKDVDFMKCIYKRIISLKYLFIGLAIFCSVQLKAQNCTVNAGFDGSACFTSNYNLNTQIDLFTLNGNSAGNFNTTPNLLWEVVSAPTGANIIFANPNTNITIVRAKLNELPSGNYVFKIGIDCQTGARVFDSVNYIISNVSDFFLDADRGWNQICANTQDSIKLVGRPLKTGEILRIGGRGISISHNNIISYANSDFYGPTTDSVRFSIKSTLSNDCSLAYWPIVNYTIRSANCQTNTKIPRVNGLADMGVQKASINKIGSRNITDTISCISNNYFNINANNICIKGGRGIENDLTNNFSVRILTGSGVLYLGGYGGSSFTYVIQNKWDTVTRNTLHTYEITFTTNGCFTTFKDTVKVFFKSAAPVSGGMVLFTTNKYCNSATDFPLSSLKSTLSIIGTIPPNYKLMSTVTGPTGCSVSISNPTSIDTLNIVGANIIPGQYYITTNVLDTITGCYALGGYTSIILNKIATLPLLRDTAVCLLNNYQIDMPYKQATLPSNEYRFSILNGPPNNNLGQNIYINNDSTITFSISSYSTPPGTYNVRVYPLTDMGTCNDARSDTFQITIVSSGHISNAGTDQLLLCNTAVTNLAGSLPSASAGMAGFWKFLPAISTNASHPIIADSSNKNTLISGFTNLSSNYFSWNVTDGNSGSYCGLQPDTVLVVYSGVPPSITQHAQADFFGILANNATYMLTSSAITPTFNLQWNKISGVGGIIVNPNSQNTNVTGLTMGNYVFELIVTNTCGIFKDTVNLYFSSGGSLPVKLLNFNGNKNNETTDILVWQVADEMNMKNYEVQISDNDFDFKTIGVVAISNSSSTNKTYDFTNNVISSSINFYRLKMVNVDGSFAYSNILKLSNKQKNINTLDVMPNPAKSNLFVHINADKVHSSSIEIVNILGQIIFRKNIQIIKGINTMPINVSNLPRGVFFIKVEDMIKKLILE
jgi:hypothetical protein